RVVGRPAMRRWVSGLALVSVLSTSACGWSFQELPIGTDLPGDSNGLTLVFVDGGSLPRGGLVKIGQAVVGRVESLQAKDFRAYVNVRIDTAISLPRGTKAAIEQTAPLGDQFINLTVPNGQSAPLHDGDTIGLEQTTKG